MSSDVDSWDPTQYDFDPRPSDEEIALGNTASERIATIRTSDRLNFRRCRRRWAWSSHLRGNREYIQRRAPLWTGTGFHFALEDCHGENLFGNPADAFRAYHEATLKQVNRNRIYLPGDLEEQVELATGMLDYYWNDWLKNRDPLKTLIHNGVPQVEVNFRVEIPWERGKYGYDRVVYSGTLDRVVIDEHGSIWIVEYKTAKTIQTSHFSNDTQVSSYVWAGNLIYGRPIAGVIYQQHRKDVPREPKVKMSGKLSTNKDQLITASSLRKHIISICGSVENAPFEYVEFLNYFTRLEDSDSDKFIRRDRIRRNEHQAAAEGEKILMEVDEMLNPDLPLYSNADRTCAFMCDFHGPCVSLDDGSDWEYELELTTKPRESKYDGWRKHVIYPNDVQNITF